MSKPLIFFLAERYLGRLRKRLGREPKKGMANTMEFQPLFVDFDFMRCQFLLGISVSCIVGFYCDVHFTKIELVLPQFMARLLSQAISLAFHWLCEALVTSVVIGRLVILRHEDCKQLLFQPENIFKATAGFEPTTSAIHLCLLVDLYIITN